jgi:hypothetical protein
VARPSVLITSIAAAGLLVSGVFLMMAPEGEEKSASKPSASAAPPSLTATPVESIAGPAEQPPSSPTSMAEIPQAPGARPAPPAPPNTLRGFKIWEGPDQAVASWYSERCGREVLRFGAQQYSKGPARVPLPPEMGPLDYSAGTQRLYGNRGAPGSLYVTSNGGSTFSEWLAVAESC